MKVTEKVDQELEGFVGALGVVRRYGGSELDVADVVCENVGDVSGCREDVGVLRASPATIAWEEAGVGWIVAECADVVQGPRPVHSVAHAVSPGCNCGKETRGSVGGGDGVA